MCIYAQPREVFVSFSYVERGVSAVPDLKLKLFYYYCNSPVASSEHSMSFYVSVYINKLKYHISFQRTAEYT